MQYVVLIVGLLITIAGVIGLVAPQRLNAMVSRFRGLRYFAVVIRFIVGLLFLLAAPHTRWPLLVQIVGVIALVAAVALLAMGAQRFAAFVDWWTTRPSGFVRGWCLAALIFGLLLIYGSGVPPALSTGAP